MFFPILPCHYASVGNKWTKANPRIEERTFEASKTLEKKTLTLESRETMKNLVNMGQRRLQIQPSIAMVEECIKKKILFFRYLGGNKRG